jgi:hypothetical protein
MKLVTDEQERLAVGFDEEDRPVRGMWPGSAA